MIINQHQVPILLAPQRLSDYLCGIFPELPSRKQVKKAIKKGLILLEGRQGYTGDWVEGKEQIQLLASDEKPRKIYPITIEVIYEDNYLAVVHKPGGLPTSGNFYKTLEHALPHNLSPTTAVDALLQPRVVHRLDGPTSGLVLVAKTKAVRQALGKQFELGQIQKGYQAIVIGCPEVPEGYLEQPIGTKAAKSHYKVLQTVPSLRNEYLSLLDLKPLTGRTHQLRIHLSQLGHPILGDAAYGKTGQILKHKGLFLTALRLEFEHPMLQQKQQFAQATPHKFTTLLAREQRRYERYHPPTR